MKLDIGYLFRKVDPPKVDDLSPDLWTPEDEKLWKQLDLDRPRSPLDWFLETIWDVISPAVGLAIALVALAALVLFVRAVWNS